MKDIFCTTPNIDATPFDGEGGIWMSGQAPALDDDGNVYLTTGNGSFDGVTDFGNCVLKLALDGGGKFEVRDFFVPTNQDFLKRKDTDLGSCGVLLLKSEKLLVAGGKEGMIYLLDARPGKLSAPINAFQVTRPPTPLFDFTRQPPQPRIGADGTQETRFWNIHGAPVMWNRPGGRFLYVCGEEEPVKVYTLVPNGGSGAPLKFASHLLTAYSDTTAPYLGAPGNRINPADTNVDSPWMPGGILALSANQDAPDPGQTAILWALMPLNANANQAVVPGVLRAYDAANFENRPDDPSDPRPPGQKAKRLVQIWASDAVPADDLGRYPKYCPPTVVNGRVVVSAFFEEEMVPDPADPVHNPNIHRIKAGGLRAALVVYGF